MNKEQLAIINKYYEDYNYLFKNQLLNTISLLAKKYNVLVDNYYNININSTYIINSEFILLKVILTESQTKEKHSKENNINIFNVMFKDDKRILVNAKDTELKKIMQILLDEVLLDYNENHEEINGYQFISNSLPNDKKYELIQNDYKNIIKEFITNTAIDDIINKFKQSSIYNNENNKPIIESQVLGLKLFNPKLRLGEFPSDAQTLLSIDAQIVDNNNKVLSNFKITKEVKFINYERFQWFYDITKMNFTHQYWQSQFENYLQKFIKNNNKGYSDESKNIKLKIMPYNALPQQAQFILAKNNQPLENINRLKTLLSTGFLNNLIVNKKYNKENDTIELKINTSLNDDLTIVCGENGIIKNDWQHYFYKVGQINLDQAKQTLKINIGIFNKSSSKYGDSYNKLLIDECNLLIDAYNKRYSINSLQQMAQLSHAKYENMKNNK